MGDEGRCPRCGAVLLPPGAACTRCLLALGLSEGAGPSETDIPLVSPVPPVEVPARIGRYRLVGTLGAGSASVVHLAEPDEPEGRRVALKVVRSKLDSREVLARFERERHALALVRHSGIAHVFDAGALEDGRTWFASEWVAGVPITEHCDRERLTVPERLELFVEVCEAVQHAHTRGVIHRDIKPSNVLVTEAEGRARPRITDLGVTHALDQWPTAETLYTAHGLLVGTPGYMSPEQSKPGSVDARTDVYALGALLYELLAGVPPFEARRLRQASWAEVVRIIRDEGPPRPSARVTTLAGPAADAARRRRAEPRELARELRGDLDRITLKALEKDRERRYPSPYDLAEDVRRHLRGEPLAVSRDRGLRIGGALRRHRLALVWAAAVLAALLAGLVMIALD